jgi:hypothetical protein
MKTKWLNLSNGRTKVLVAVRKIRLIQTRGDRTVIFFNSKSNLEVEETREEILELLGIEADSDDS